MASARQQTVFGVFKGMGDLLWAVPAISAELDRGAEVHLLLFPGAALRSFCDLLDFGPNTAGLHIHAVPGHRGEVLPSLAAMRSLSPQLVWVSPHAPAADSSWKVPLALRLLKLVFWPRAHLTGADSERLSWLFDRTLPLDRSLPLRCREWSAYSLLHPELPATPPAVRFLPEIMARRSAPPACDLVIHPGANAANRFWPAEHYPSLLVLLPASWKVLVLGLPADVTALRAAIEASSVTRAIDYISGTLHDSLLTLASARVALVMDSGNMHFAEVLGVPAVALFGQQDPARVIGTASGTVEAIYRPTVPCQPCNRAVCSQPRVFCLTNLDPVHIAQRLVARHHAAQ